MKLALLVLLLSATWPMYQLRPDHNAVLPGGPGVVWAHQFRAKINGGLALANGTIYVESFDGLVSALDARTGALRWASQAGGVVMTTPIVADGVVVVGTGTSSVLTQSSTRVVWGRSQGDAVTAFDAGSGRRVWTYRTIGEDMPSPALVRIGSTDAVVFANGDDHIRALAVRTGRLLWQAPVQGIDSMSSAAVEGGTVFVLVGGPANSTVSDHVLAVDSQSGRIRWSARYGNADCSPTVAYHRVFVEGSSTISNRPANRNALNDVAALDEETGKLRWRWYSDLGTFTGVASDEEAIAGLAADGAFYEGIPAVDQFAAFDAQSGHARWSLRTDAAVKMSAVERNGRLYFGDTGHTFYVVDARSGRVLSHMRYSKFFTTASPVIAGNTLYVANDDAVRATRLGTK